MKAVNLIPEEAAKGARPKLAISAQGIGAYAVIAVLAIAVVLVGAWATTNKQVNDRQSELAKVERDAQVAEAKVAALKPYTEFASLSKARVETVRGLVDGRFDWAHGLREVARVVPADVDLMSLVGSVSPAAQVEGATTGKLRPGLALPAFDLSGCAKSQSDVALLLARLRAIDGVERVSLASSEKSDSASQGATDCRKTIKMPQFQVTVFFKANDGLVVAAAGTPAQPASPASPATSAAPAASSTASAGGVVK
jgi:Tfp pilus assembly protein PilN